MLSLLNNYDFKKAMAKRHLDQWLRQLGHYYESIQECRTILEMLKAYPELAAKRFGPTGAAKKLGNTEGLPFLHLLSIPELPVDILKEVYEMHPPAIFSNSTHKEDFCSPLFFAIYMAHAPDVISFLISKNPEAVSEPNSRGVLPIQEVGYHYCNYDEDVEVYFSVLKMLLDVAPVGIFATDINCGQRSLFYNAVFSDIPNVRDLITEKIPRGVLHNAVLPPPYTTPPYNNLLFNFFNKLDSDQKINLRFWKCHYRPSLANLASIVAAMADSVVSLNLDNCFTRGQEIPADDAGPDWSSCLVEKITLSNCVIPPSKLQWLLRGIGTMPNLSELHLHTEHPTGPPQVYSEVLEAFVHPPLQLLEIRGFVMERNHLVEMLTESTGECTIIFQGPNEPEPLVAISYYSAINCHARGISNWTTKSLLIGGLLAVQADQRVLGPFKFPVLYGLMQATPSLWALE